MPRSLLAMLVAVLLLASCGDGPRPWLEEGASVDLGPLRFEPEGPHKVYRYTDGLEAWRIAGFVATERVREPCQETSQGIECRGEPVRHRGFVLHDFQSPNPCMARLPEGESRTIAGFPAALQRDAGDAGLLFRADRTLVITLLDRGGCALFYAALRGPDIDAVEAELLAYLDTATPRH